MVESLTNAFIELFRAGNLLMRLTSVAVLILAFFLVESYTGFGFNLRMNHKVNLLAKLNDLNETPLKQEEDLLAIRNDVVGKLSVYAQQDRGISFVTNWLTPVRITKFLTASCLWFVGSFVALRTQNTVGSTVPIFITLLVLSALMGTVGALIPTVWHPALNYAFNFAALGVLPIFLIANAGNAGTKTS